MHRISAPVSLRFGRRSRRGRAFVWVAAITLLGAAVMAGALLTVGVVYPVYYDRRNLPDLGPFTRFEFPTVGHIYDRNGQPIIELAREHRRIAQYNDIPPIVRDAILAAEDKRFFSHSGVDYYSFPRVLAKIRMRAWVGELAGGDRSGGAGRSLFPQGGSTITQQLVRGVFLQQLTIRENSRDLQSQDLLPRILGGVVGVRTVNMALRKREELRLSLWVEAQLGERFGSKRLAKEALFARYASFVYMGSGQYGFARAADYYLGRPLSSLTADDAESAALLAGIMKSPRDYAPTARNTAAVLRRRNQTLALMAEAGFLSRAQVSVATRRPVRVVVPRAASPFQSSAVVEHVLDALARVDAGLGMDDLLQGHIQVHSTVDARVQRAASEALEQGLQRYEARHLSAVGVVQGSIVVLSNRDGSILAEAGGRQVYQGRAAAYSNFNRVRRSMRQPGSAMKPIVYLAAFQHGGLTLDTLVPDEPISVPGRRHDTRKWIANYDGQFKGMIPVRQALAESRNAVAIWITERVGIDRVLRTARALGVETRLQRYATTALGASDVSLLELATAYRSIASGLHSPPYVIREIVRASGETVAGDRERGPHVSVDADALAMIQEGLRGVVRMPTGTAHALAARAFPIAVMGKTGTTNAFRDALFVGSTYGIDGITIAVRIGFDDNRTLGSGETGSRVALPVFRELMLAVYRDGLVGPAPAFPQQMERRITRFLRGDPLPVDQF